jgi:endoglycosylceramidase
VVAIGAIALTLSGPAAASWPPPEPISPAGRWLVDADGRVVVLRGLNVVDKRPPYLPSSLGFGADDARFLQRSGFDAVRLGFIHKGYEPRRGHYDEAYLEQIVDTIGVLHDAGLAVVLDFHQDYFNERAGGEGFPDWMVLLTGPPTRPDALPFDAFWANVNGFQDAFAAAWGRVAARLARVPGIAGYDLLNEPYPGTLEGDCAQARGCTGFDRNILGPFYARVLRALRAGDGQRIAFVEPHVVFNAGAPSWLGGLSDRRVGFSFHVYCQPAPAWAGIPGCDRRRPTALDNAEAVAARNGWPLLMSEFGATDDESELRVMTDEADDRMLSWLEWAYWNRDPFAARPHEGLIGDIGLEPQGANVKAGKLALLARPYPRAVAGTPAGWSWSRESRTFRARWSTKPAGAVAPGPGAATEIVLPRPSYPAGWHVVAIEGGRRVASGEDDVLAVAAQRDAAFVSVTVGPGAPKTRPAKPKAKRKKAKAKRKTTTPKRKKQRKSKARPRR